MNDSLIAELNAWRKWLTDDGPDPSHPDDPEKDAFPATLDEAATALAKLQAENTELLGLAERLRREAEQWAQEARTQRSSLHQAYQAVTGATGEPGDWNGARPIIEAVAELIAQRDAAREALERARERVFLMGDWIAEETRQLPRISRARVYLGEIDAAISASRALEGRGG